MNSLKIFGFAVAAVLVVSVAPVAAHAADMSYDYYDTYTSSSNNSSSYDYYDTYTPSSNKTSSSYDYYDTYTPTPSTPSTPTYDYYDTYTPSYSTPTYDYYDTYTPSYSTPTYTCIFGCGGTTYTPPSYVQPTCSLSASNATINAGDTVTIGWSSTNASWGNISNLGSYLPTSGSRQVTLNNTTTFNGTFYGQGGTATCATTVTVTPKAPTCTIVGPDTATAGQTITLNWSSTNSSYGNITNLGTNLPATGSHSFQIGNTTTFTGTFYGVSGQTTTCQKTVTVNNYCPSGYSGTYPNCYPPQNNNLSCTISVNNYQNGYNNYFAPNTAVTLSWNSNGATYGSINQGLGTVNPSGSRTIYPTQTTTYTGTFYNYQGQQVTCSATVYVQGYIPPQNPNIPFVTLSAVPYTGLDLGPVGTVLYWAFLAFWCALAAYLIVVKKVQNSVYASLKGILFGSAVSHSASVAAYTTHASHDSHAAAPAQSDATDSFILSQINRVR